MMARLLSIAKKPCQRLENLSMNHELPVVVPDSLGIDALSRLFVSDERQEFSMCSYSRHFDNFECFSSPVSNILIFHLTGTEHSRSGDQSIVIIRSL
jgi:hypothetical protein